MAGIDLGLSGLASGFDWKAFIDQMMQVESAPGQRLLLEQTRINQQNATWSNIKSQLATLQTRAQALKEATLFDSRTAQSSDSTLANALAAQGAALGTFTFNITQLATASRINGASNVGTALSPTN